MRLFTQYHVVTEKPMFKGQVITFDVVNHNSVYNRVDMTKRILAGENPTGDVADMIINDINKWSKIAYRECAMENVREIEFPLFPSRMACMYTSNSWEEAVMWANYFKELGRKVYSIVLLEVQGRFFSGNACNCFDGSMDDADNHSKARKYWLSDNSDTNVVVENIVDGRILVLEVVEDFTVK